jgi:hypothetical protein
VSQPSLSPLEPIHAALARFQAITRGTGLEAYALDAFDALADVQALVEAAQLIQVFDQSGGSDWWEAHAKLYATLARFADSPGADEQSEWWWEKPGHVDMERALRLARNLVEQSPRIPDEKGRVPGMSSMLAFALVALADDQPEEKAT